MRHDHVIDGRTSIAGPRAVVALLADDYAGLAHERLTILHLDRRFGLIHAQAIDGGRTVIVPIRRIAREALAHGTRALVIAHNHPAGSHAPSRADRIATRRLAEALRPLSILLADHIVFGRDGWTSFRALGLV